jgi:hypothetical protein
MRFKHDASLSDRIKDIVVKYTIRKGDCILYTGKLSAQGYVTIRYNKKLYSVHRLIAAQKAQVNFETLSFDIDAHHSCQNRNCLNIEHLELIAKCLHPTVGNIKMICKRGHDISIVGRRSNGQCIACYKEDNKGIRNAETCIEPVMDNCVL